MLTARDNIWEFPFADACVLVRWDSHDLYILNPSAGYAWSLLQSSKDVSQASLEFAQHFNIPSEIAAHDLQLTWGDWEKTLLAPFIPTPTTPPQHLPDPSPTAFSRIYSLYGKSIRIVLHDPELIAEIAPRLESLPISSVSKPVAILEVAASDTGYHIFVGSTWIASEGHAADARAQFLLELVRAARGNRQWAAILHAGACGSGSKCVIFPAASHSGKTTLSAVLMHSGLALYADDSVALERTGLGIPAMPFSLMVREGSWSLVSERFPGFQNLPVYDRNGHKVKFLHPMHEPDEASAQACAIVFSRWESAVKTTIHPLNAFDALVRLKDTGFWLAHDRGSIQKFLTWLASVPAYEMIYSEVDEAVVFIKQLIHASEVEACRS